jgi:amino acid adenylation domain-containing protein
VEGTGAVWDYATLWQVAGRFAGHLASSGVHPGDRVAIGVRKSPEAVAAILGTLGSGCIFVPLDPGAPPARLSSILADCGARVLVASPARAQGLLSALPPERRPARTVLLGGGAAGGPPAEWAAGGHVVHWDDALSSSEPAAPARRAPSDPAYILYTSGSTGLPKGVSISHENALAFTSWAARRFALGPGDRVTSVAPFHFDLSTFDLYSTIEAGGTIVLVPREVALLPAALAAFLESSRATVTYLVPSSITGMLLRGDLAARDLSRLRTLLFAGEVLPAPSLRMLMESFPRLALYNLYGPTETNVCTCYEVAPGDAARPTPVPIGLPASGDTIFALDDEGRRVEGPGVEGELHCAGPTVALGYWGDEEKTARSFLAGHPAAPPGTRVYRTGDRVSIDTDGQWVFHGRRDHMVKCRGFRIELGDVEAALHAHAAVAEAAAFAVPDPEAGNRLLACVSLRPSAGIGAAELLRHCAERLPRYMVPESVAILPSLPKTSSGKIDRAGLAAAAPRR